MQYTENEPVYADADMKDAALKAMDLAKRLSHQYPVLLTALTIASAPESAALLPPPKEIESYPSFTIARKNSVERHGFLPHFFLREVPQVLREFQKSYMADALTVLADALKENDYFGHDPSLEMVYHLRNGVAHGNKFNFTSSGLERLSKYPAHNRDTWRRGGDKQEFEITPALQGKPVLFNYMMDGDVLDVIHEVATCLQKKATGQPVLPPENR